MVATHTSSQNQLRLLFWETTAGCNLECIHCRRLDVSKELMQNDMSTAEAKAFISDLAAVAQPILVLSGGEPLFRPDIFEIATHARDSGLVVALATNGTLVNESMADQIVASGIRRVSVSIDGADATTHDHFRQQEGSLAAALNGLRLLRARGMSTQINCTITQHNVHQLETLYAMAKELGADALHLFMLVPVGCGVQIAESAMLPATEYERVLNWMYDKTKLRELHLKATCAPHYFRVVRQRAREEGVRIEVSHSMGKPTGAGRPGGHPGGQPGGGHPGNDMSAMTKGCLAGSAICFVSHSGEVFPCGYLPVSAGNVRQQSIGQIWANSTVFERLRDDELLEGKCGCCEYKRVCMGCRARAFYDSDGDYMAEEPYCVYEPKRMKHG